jgi:hypothetical protein
MNSAPRFLRIVVFSALAACLASGLVADTPSPTPSPTPTETGTPGSGSYTYTIMNGLLTPQSTPFVAPGSTGNVLQIAYTAAAQFSNGTLVFQFPPDLCATPQPDTGGEEPNQYSFFADPQDQGYVPTPVAFNGQAVTITVNSLAAGQSLIFDYGLDSTGFSVVSAPAQTSESFMVWANPAPAVVAGVGLVPAPSPILIYTATVTPTMTSTFTASPSFTVTLTNTISPTFTVSPTNTPSPTDTPVGPVQSPVGFYTYPNPFDLRIYSDVTVRFQPTDEPVSISVFSLLGNPVREIPQSAIQASMGVAQWDGTDDYGRTVAGGLYFVRLKTPTHITVHKMTVFH